MRIDQKSFSKRLINWYLHNKRELPWRETTDPYFIWLSEIILQQTRVEQGLPYYLNFADKYPTVFDLANAPEVEVLRMWQGLGYYSRARNLHACAKQVVEEYNGKFPADYNKLKSLKGIGEYTASAIGSFAFGLPTPVLDGNVFRVIARLFGINDDIANPKSKKSFYGVLDQLIPESDPGNFNQGMMEFGATHCTPKNPNCESCIFSTECIANQTDQQNQLPVKLKKVKVRKRTFNYLVIVSEQGVYMKQRGPKDIWEGLFDFPLLESETFSLESALKKEQLKNLILLDQSEPYKHILTHQRINAVFWVVQLSDFGPFEEILGDMKAYNENEMLNLPKPKLVDNYLKEHFFSLHLI